MVPGRIGIALTMVMLSVGVERASAQPDPDECSPYVLAGTVLQCAAAGTPRMQLRTATFIAGSAAAGEALAQAIGLEVATAPFGSSSGGFTFTFDSSRLAVERTASTFGPAFSERALTVGKGKLSAGFNLIDRTYDRFNGLDLAGFTVFQFRGGSLPVSTSTLELEIGTDTFAGFAHYGVLNSLDVGVAVPYVRVVLQGVSRIFAQPGEELQRVHLNASSSGVGDVAIFGKYRFWQVGRTPTFLAGQRPSLGGRHAALAVGLTARLPTGDSDDLVGLGVGRVLVSLIGSAEVGRYSPHVNVGYEFWSDGIEMPRDFQGRTTLSTKDQVLYSAGLELEAHPRLTVIGDFLGRYLRGGGQVGYQPFFFSGNRSGVQGAEALVSIPGGFQTLTFAPGAKWNFYGAALLTGSLLISITEGGLQDRVTPVIGVDWGF